MSDNLQGFKRTHRNTDLTVENIGDKVSLTGWVNKKRNYGNLLFVDVRDRTGLIQLVFDSETNDAGLFEKAKSLRSEFVIAATGEVRKRAGAENPDMKTGKIEVVVDSLRILSEAEVPPFNIFDAEKTKEDLRLKYRYLDLRRPELMSKLIKRSQIVNACRNYMQEHGFLEIETPILINSTPEGARDYLVPSRIHNGKFYALPQSPQLFKQLLMCAGYDRYFQIAKCFRDEDLRADRQPEFTQIDMELSFVDMEDVIEVNEGLLKHIFGTIGVDVKLPIQRMSYDEAMRRYGSDKPDTRFEMELCSVDEVVKDCGFQVFTDAIASGGTVVGITVKGQVGMPRKKIDALVEMARGYGAKGLAYMGFQEDGGVKSSFSKFMSEEEILKLKQAMKAENGDLILLSSDKKDLVLNLMGAVRLYLGKELGLIDESKYNFLWIVDFPLLEYSEEHDRLVAKHHPFTMPKDEDIPLLDSDPLKVRAKAYDIVLNGNEIGGGSVRIFNPEIQNKMFEVLGFTGEQAQNRFGYLLEAFKYGVPPHAGLAYGLDRLIMLMTGTDNIREVIAFPKVKDASCMMTNAPSVVDDIQLEELGIQIKEQKELGE